MNVLDTADIVLIHTKLWYVIQEFLLIIIMQYSLHVGVSHTVISIAYSVIK